AAAAPGRARQRPAHAEPPAARDRRDRDGAARAGAVSPLWLTQAETADLQQRNLWERRSIGRCSRASPLPRTVAPIPSALPPASERFACRPVETSTSSSRRWTADGRCAMTTTLGALRAPHTLISIIGAASALGAPHAGSAAAPAALQGGALMHRLAAIGPSVEWTETLRPTAAERAAGTPGAPAADRPSAPASAAAADMATRIAANAAFAHRLADHLAALPTDSFPLVLGGDHAIAAGTWRVVGRRRGRAPGLIWIDAHLDSHTDAT